MHKSTAKKCFIEIPHCNHRDVEFLNEIRNAHNHDKLSIISTNVESALRRRIEDEFLGQAITPKIRADITEFCLYLLSISKLFGYPILIGGLITTIHKEIISIKTRCRNPSLLEATFTYFDCHGNYEMTANGFIRSDLSISPDDPISRRSQIMRDNNNTFPGFSSKEELCEKHHIHIEVPGQLPVLVLPVSV